MSFCFSRAARVASRLTTRSSRYLYGKRRRQHRDEAGAKVNQVVGFLCGQEAWPKIPVPVRQDFWPHVGEAPIAVEGSALLGIIKAVGGWEIWRDGKRSPAVLVRLRYAD